MAAVGCLLAAGLAVGPQAVAAPNGSNVRDACGPAKPGQARCYAQIRTDIHQGPGVRTATDLPPGYSPADLRAAYRLPAAGGKSQTVAVVDAGDDAAAESDLAVYRKTFGLPACTTANGCFRKVNQRGQSAPLPQSMGWGVEIALDLDMVSAACPDCKIVLAEADDPGADSLAAAVNGAVKLGATEVSNSYGAGESGGTLAYASAYSHPGVAITASSGDGGYAAVPSFPAVLKSVVAVGGSSLVKASNARGWSEAVWNSNGGAAGSGCSAWVAKPAWQHDKNCPGRMIADISADADPLTGPSVYGTVDGLTGWAVVGGTSASAPYVAGVIALAGHPERYADASYLYSHPGRFNDVVKGGNVVGGPECGGDYQCTAREGYDGPTGLGTPSGLAGF
jgi:subtilase family serine protease